MEMLKPVEAPSGIMKLAYLFSKLKFGKVLSPLKIVYARLPLSFGLFSNKISGLEKKLVLERDLQLMIRHHVAQINGCDFCMDIGIAIAIKDKSYSEKFYRLHEYKTNPMYSEKERAALHFAEELTVTRKISRETFAAARKALSERELVEVAWLVSTEFYYNLMNHAFEVPSDGLCQVRKRG